MKKSFEILVHLLFWVLFTAFVVVSSKMFLQAQPNAAFGQHFFYVVVLELVMGLLFFYVTFLGIRWALKKKGNLAILSGILCAMLIIFAFPASRVGSLEVMSSVVPHVMLILLALVFRRFSGLLKPVGEENTKFA
jgi:purine-cytosine permease-like protein